MREIRLHNNESPFAPESLLKNLYDIDYSKAKLNLYLNQEKSNILKALAKYTNLDEEMIVAASGGDHLLGEIFNSLSGEAGKVLISTPTFFLYQTIAQKLRLEIIDVPLDKDFNLQVDKIIQEANSSGTELIVICRPNNPTGNIFPKEDVIKIIENVDAYVLVDEAYFEFANDTLANELSNYPNLVILRTFSKAFAAAGLRLGYGLANKEVRDKIRKYQTFYNISNITQLLGIRLVENFDLFKPYIEKMKDLREEFRAKLNNIDGIYAYPCQTNFLLVKMDVDFDDLANYLESKGILIRPVHKLSPLIADTVRVSVSSQDDNNSFIEALKEYLSKIS